MLPISISLTSFYLLKKNMRRGGGQFSPKIGFVLNEKFIYTFSSYLFDWNDALFERLLFFEYGKISDLDAGKKIALWTICLYIIVKENWGSTVFIRISGARSHSFFISEPTTRSESTNRKTFRTFSDFLFRSFK